MARKMQGAASSCSSMPAAALIVGAIASAAAAVQAIGVNYGAHGSNLPSPSDVVELYRVKGITDMRVYVADKEILEALRNSGIGLMLDVGEAFGDVAASAGNAASWVQNYVRPYYPAVDIRYVVAGNEVTGDAAQSILPAMRNLNGALWTDAIADASPPSGVTFAQPYLVEVAREPARSGAPLLVNAYPYFAHRQSPGENGLGYATFRPGTAVRDGGNGLTYTNLLDAMVDAAYAALEKAGAPGVRVVVSESGWPSAGGFAASPENARAYNHVTGGTPRRPGPLEAYIFAMFNEDKKQGGETERHFGLFNSEKSLAYAIRF